MLTKTGKTNHIIVFNLFYTMLNFKYFAAKALVTKASFQI